MWVEKGGAGGWGEGRGAKLPPRLGCCAVTKSMTENFIFYHTTIISRKDMHFLGKIRDWGKLYSAPKINTLAAIKSTICCLVNVIKRAMYFARGARFSFSCLIITNVRKAQTVVAFIYASLRCAPR